MEGRANGGKVAEEDLERLKKVADRIQFFYNHQPVTPLQLTTPPGHIQRKFQMETSFGPEPFFGILLAEQHPDDEFVFINGPKAACRFMDAGIPTGTPTKRRSWTNWKIPSCSATKVRTGNNCVLRNEMLGTRKCSTVSFWLRL